MQIRARAVSDLSQLRASRIAHICTEEPIAEEEELAPTVRTAGALAHRALLRVPATNSGISYLGKARFGCQWHLRSVNLRLLHAQFQDFMQPSRPHQWS